MQPSAARLFSIKGTRVMCWSVFLAELAYETMIHRVSAVPDYPPKL